MSLCELCFLVPDARSFPSSSRASFHASLLHSSLCPGSFVCPGSGPIGLLYLSLDSPSSVPVPVSVSGDREHREEKGKGKYMTPSEVRPGTKFVVTQSCKLKFVYAKYKTLVCLDVSRSVSVLDPCAGRVLFEYYYHTLALALVALVQKFCIVEKEMEPVIVVGVVAHQSVNSVEPVKILLEPRVISKKNVATVLMDLFLNLVHLEEEFSIKKQTAANEKDSQNIVRRSVSDSKLAIARLKIVPPHLETNQHQNSFRDLKNLIQNCLFLLSQNFNCEEGAPMIWLLTDGVASISDIGCIDSVLINCTRQDVPVSVFQLASSHFHANQNFGYVSDSDLLEFIAHSTGGLYFDRESIEDACTELVEHFSCSSNESDTLKSLLALSDWMASRGQSKNFQLDKIEGGSSFQIDMIFRSSPLIDFASSVVDPLILTSSPLHGLLSPPAHLNTWSFLDPLRACKSPLNLSLKAAFTTSFFHHGNSNSVHAFGLRSSPGRSRRSSISSSNSAQGKLGFLSLGKMQRLSTRGISIPMNQESDQADPLPQKSTLIDFSAGLKLHREKVKEYRLNIDICRLIEIRTNGGFKDVRTELAFISSAANSSTPGISVKMAGKNSNSLGPQTAANVFPAMIITMFLVWRPSITIEYQIIALCSTVEKVKNDEFEDFETEKQSGSSQDFGNGKNRQHSGTRRVIAALAANGLELGPILRNSELRIEIRIASSYDFITKLQISSQSQMPPKSSSTTNSFSSVANRLSSFIAAVHDIDRLLSHLAAVKVGQTFSGGNIPTSAHHSSALWTVLASHSTVFWKRIFTVECFDVLCSTSIPFQALNGKFLYQKTIARTLQTTLSHWASLTHSQHLFIKFFANASRNVVETSLPLCLIRITWQTKSLISLQLGFFACEFLHRCAIISDLQLLISKTYIMLPAQSDVAEAAKIYPFTVLEHPLSCILNRPDITNQDSTNSELNSIPISSNLPIVNSREAFNRASGSLSDLKEQRISAASTPNLNNLNLQAPSSVTNSVNSKQNSLFGPVPDGYCRPFHSLSFFMRRASWYLCPSLPEMRMNLIEALVKARFDHGFFPIFAENQHYISVRCFLLNNPLEVCASSMEVISCLKQGKCKPVSIFFQSTIALIGDAVVVDVWMECIPGFYCLDLQCDSPQLLTTIDIFGFLVQNLFSNDSLLASFILTADTLSNLQFLSEKSQPFSVLQYASWQEVRQVAGTLSPICSAEVLMSMHSPTLPYVSNPCSNFSTEFHHTFLFTEKTRLHPSLQPLTFYGLTLNCMPVNFFHVFFDSLALIARLSPCQFELSVPFGLLYPFEVIDKQVASEMSEWLEELNQPVKDLKTKESIFYFHCKFLEMTPAPAINVDLIRMYHQALCEVAKEISDLELIESFLFCRILQGRILFMMIPMLLHEQNEFQSYLRCFFEAVCPPNPLQNNHSVLFFEFLNLKNASPPTQNGSFFAQSGGIDYYWNNLTGISLFEKIKQLLSLSNDDRNEKISTRLTLRAISDYLFQNTPPIGHSLPTEKLDSFCYLPIKNRNTLIITNSAEKKANGSEEIEMFMSHLFLIQKFLFARMVYYRYFKNLTVSIQDFNLAIQSTVRHRMDIDASALYRSNGRGLLNLAPSVEFILSSIFKPVPGTEFLYFSPAIKSSRIHASTKKFSDSFVFLSGTNDLDMGELGSDEIDLEYENLIAASPDFTIPIFLRLEQRIKFSNIASRSIKKISVYSDSIIATFDANTLKLFEDRAIAEVVEGFSPSPPSTSQCMLRLALYTLPQASFDSFMKQVLIFPSPSSSYAPLSSLAKPIRIIARYLSRKMKLLIINENLADLLPSSHFLSLYLRAGYRTRFKNPGFNFFRHDHALYKPVSEIVSGIRSNMAVLAKLCCPFLIAFSIPLVFVDLDLGRKRFPEELMRCEFLPIFKVQIDSSSNESQLFWLFAEPNFLQSKEMITDSPFSLWSCLAIQGDSVLVMLHSYRLSENAMESLKSEIHLGIEQLCLRVNQSILLAQMNERRVCSDLLIVPTPEDEEEKPRTAKKQVESFILNNLYSPGQLACKCVHTSRFNLHPRLPINRALNILSSTALHQFVVTNRRNVYVYQERSGAVFYLRLSSGVISESKRHVSIAFPDRLNDSLVSTPHSSPPNSPSRQSGLLSLSVAPPVIYDQVLLEVCGIEIPTEEITVQLHRMIANRLATITLGLISTLLQRNPLFKFAPADANLVRPENSSPEKAIAIALPKNVKDINVFLLLFKQNLAPYLNSLNLTSTNDSNPLNAMGDQQSRFRYSVMSGFDPKSVRSYSSDLQFGTNNFATNRTSSIDELKWVYNFNPPSQLLVSDPIFNSIGKGLAFIFGSVLSASSLRFVPLSAPVAYDKMSRTLWKESIDIAANFRSQVIDLEPVSGGFQSFPNLISLPDTPSLNAPALDNLTHIFVKGSNQKLETFLTDNASEHILIFELWILGSVSPAELVKHLHVVFEATLAEYTIEMGILRRFAGDISFKQNRVDQGWVENVLKHVQNGVRSKCASLHQTSISCVFPRWALANIATQFASLTAPLNQIHPCSKCSVFTPVILSANDAEGIFCIKKPEAVDSFLVLAGLPQVALQARRKVMDDTTHIDSVFTDSDSFFASFAEPLVNSSWLIQPHITCMDTTGEVLGNADSLKSVAFASGSIDSHFVFPKQRDSVDKELLSKDTNREKEKELSILLFPRRAFLFLLLETDRIVLISYNLNFSLTIQIQAALFRLISWQRQRCAALNFVYMHKMGALSRPFPIPTVIALPRLASSNCSESQSYYNTVSPLLSVARIETVFLSVEIFLDEFCVQRVSWMLSHELQFKIDQFTTVETFQLENIAPFLQFLSPFLLPLAFPSKDNAGTLSSSGGPPILASVSSKEGRNSRPPVNSLLNLRKRQLLETVKPKNSQVPQMETRIIAPDAFYSPRIAELFSFRGNLLSLPSLAEEVKLFVFSFFKPKNPNLIGILLQATLKKLSQLKKDNFNIMRILLSRLPYHDKNDSLSFELEDPAQKHGLHFVQLIFQACQASAYFEHHDWSIAANGDLRKLNSSQIQELPFVASASRVVALARAPLLFNSICAPLFTTRRGDIFLSLKHLANVPPLNSSPFASFWKHTIAPYDVNVVESSAPWLAYAKQQTNAYYRILESFLQDYCKYLENILDARVIVVMDGTEANTLVQSELDATTNGFSLTSKANHSFINGTLLLEDSLVTLKPIRVFLQRSAHGQPLLAEIRFHHYFVSVQLYVADLPFIWSPSHGTHILGAPISNFVNSGSLINWNQMKLVSLQKKAAKFASAEKNSSKFVQPEISPGFVYELNHLANSLHLGSFLYDFHLRQCWTHLFSLDYTFNLNIPEFVSALAHYHRTPPAHARNHLFANTLDVAIPYFDFNVLDFFHYMCSHVHEYLITQHQQWSTHDWLSLTQIARKLAKDFNENNSKDSVDFLQKEQARALNFVLLSKNGKFGHLDISAFENDLKSTSCASLVPVANRETEAVKTRISYALICTLSDSSIAFNSPAPYHADNVAPRIVCASKFESNALASVESKVNFLKAKLNSFADQGPCSDEKIGKRFGIQYYLMRVDTENSFPYSEGHSGPYANMDWNSLECYLYQQVIPEVHSCLESLLLESIISFKRDCLWKEILLSHFNIVQQFSSADMNAFLKLTSQKLLTTIDPTLKVLSHLNSLAPQLVGYLFNVYSGRVKLYFVENVRHIFVLPSNGVDDDMLIHVVIVDSTFQDRNASVAYDLSPIVSSFFAPNSFSFCRELFFFTRHRISTSGNEQCSALERKIVSQFVNALCLFAWKCCN